MTKTQKAKLAKRIAADLATLIKLYESVQGIAGDIFGSPGSIHQFDVQLRRAKHEFVLCLEQLTEYVETF